MGNTPKVQTDDAIPVKGTSPAANADGRTPHGTPEEAGEHAPSALPNDSRLATETAPVNIEQGKPEQPAKR